MWNNKVNLPAVSGTVILVCIQFLWIQEVSSVAFRRTSYQGREHKQECHVYVTEASGEEDCLWHCDEFGYKCLHAAYVGNMCYVCIETNIYQEFSNKNFNNTHSHNTQHLIGASHKIYERTDIVDECLSNPCVRGVCDNREGGYYCECPVGYTGVQCESVVTCPSLSNPSYGTVTYSNRNIGSVATYSCGTGYVLIDGTRRICESNGQWSLQIPTCLDVKNKALDCANLYKAGKRSNGAYKVYSKDLNNNFYHEVQVYCDMTANGGGWTVFQRRYDGGVLFNRNWEEYKNGFGNILGEHWLGNKYISMMTILSSTKYKLRVDLRAFDSQTAYAEYSDFMVASESEKFKMTFGSFIGGTAGDSLSYHNGMQFSTYDNDNDKASYSCSDKYGGRGGWWYNSCDTANVNGGVYHTSQVNDDDSLHWGAWLGNYKALKGSIMAIRPNNF